MNSKNVIIVILTLTTIGGAVFGWQQYKRASALDTQVASLTKAAADRAERSQRRSSGERAQTTTATAEQPPPDAPRPEGDRGPGRGDWQARGANMRALLESPEAAKLMASQQRGMIESRYAGLFKSLNLTPDQLAKFKDLLAEKQNAARDVMSVAREQGLDFRGNRNEIQQLVQQSNADIDATIATAIGQDKFAQYQSYDQTQPQRAVTSQLEQRLSYTSEPLSATQSQQLVDLLAANTTAPTEGERGPRTFVATYAGPPGGGGAMMMGGGATSGVQITDKVITSAQSFLSTSQVDALRQMQTEQSDQKQLQQLLMGDGNSGGSSSGENNSSGGDTQNRRRRGR